MKIIIIFILQISSFQVYAQSRMVSKAQEALMSYSIVKDKSEEIVDDVKRKTLGEHSDKLLFLAPFVTGKLELNANQISFYYDHNNDQEAGLRYNLKF